ncbi:conjugal transfer protein [Lysinibacillus sp. KU-BSD001]|uniref:conjugal transfer protein n=1 Tax=Lysinibacillus sp. KU-BSD001 TaxID=3141328 RepID=UPI0036EB74DB
MAKERKTKALLKGFKRLSDDEKQKAEQRKLERKGKKLNNFTPKGYRARRVGVYTFWTLFVGMFLFVGLLVLSNGSDDSDVKDEILYDKVASQEATVFAQNFIKAYFTWKRTDEGIVARQQALAPYLANGLDVNAGLVTKSVNWDSTYLSSQVRDVETIEEGIGQITFQVNSKLSNGEAEKVVEQFMIVPIAFDGETFGVYGLPKFTDITDYTTVKIVTDKRLKTASTDESNEIKAFVETFFKTYVEGEYEQLRYLLVKDSKITGLNSTYVFNEVGEVEVLKDEAETGFIANVDVLVTNPVTSIQTLMNYQLSIKKSADKFVVQAMDDMTGKEIKSKSASDVEKELLSLQQQKEALMAKQQAEALAQQKTAAE